jgi:hypothetical protein
VPIGDLPGFDVPFVSVLVTFAVIVFVEVIVVVVLVRVVDGMFEAVVPRHFVTYDAGSATGFGAVAATAAAAGFGGGYVVQKCRPHLLQTQN